jgi:hypothetical protein
MDPTPVSEIEHRSDFSRRFFFFFFFTERWIRNRSQGRKSGAVYPVPVTFFSLFCERVEEMRNSRLALSSSRSQHGNLQQDWLSFYRLSHSRFDREDRSTAALSLMHGPLTFQLWLLYVQNDARLRSNPYAPAD